MCSGCFSGTSTPLVFDNKTFLLPVNMMHEMQGVDALNQRSRWEVTIVS